MGRDLDTRHCWQGGVEALRLISSPPLNDFFQSLTLHCAVASISWQRVFSLRYFSFGLANLPSSFPPPAAFVRCTWIGAYCGAPPLRVILWRHCSFPSLTVKFWRLPIPWLDSFQEGNASSTLGFKVMMRIWFPGSGGTWTFCPYFRTVALVLLKKITWCTKATAV